MWNFILPSFITKLCIHIHSRIQHIHKIYMIVHYRSTSTIYPISTFSLYMYPCIHVSVYRSAIYLSICLSVCVDFWPKINAKSIQFPTQRPSGRQSLETLHWEPGWEIPLLHVAIAGKLMTCIYISADPCREQGERVREEGARAQDIQ